MTKDEIYSVFDGGDPEIALMKLAVSFPEFGLRDLEGAIKTLASSGDEYAPDPSRRGPRPMASNSHLLFPDPPARSRGMDAFRTIFFIMFRTDAWDGEILTRPGFLDFVRSVKDELARRDRAAKYHDRWTSELYEALAEMEDRLAEKIKAMPEGTACAGSRT